MNSVHAEFRKLLTLRAVVVSAVVGCVAPVLLAAHNAATVHTARLRGRADTVTSDLSAIGSAELLLAVAAAAVIGALSVGSEYRPLPVAQGGGRQATTTGLAQPLRGRAMTAKAVATSLLVAVMALAASGGCLLAADHFLGSDAPTLDPARWALGLRGALYVSLTGLLSLAIAALLRSGLVPLVYLVANSTVVSPGFLLTRVTRWAWYLPDTSGMSLLPGMPDPDRPSPLVGGCVMLLWVTALTAAAAVADTRRDA